MKNKEWLKEEIESDGVQLEYLYANYYTDDKAIMIDDVRHLIDQLEEPEITEEQAWEVIGEAYTFDKKTGYSSFFKTMLNKEEVETWKNKLNALDFEIVEVTE